MRLFKGANLIWEFTTLIEAGSQTNVKYCEGMFLSDKGRTEAVSSALHIQICMDKFLFGQTVPCNEILVPFTFAFHSWKGHIVGEINQGQ